jgi:hypothetical protein
VLKPNTPIVRITPVKIMNRFCSVDTRNLQKMNGERAWYSGSG